jgi:indole-3-glycerol phosphate synthase
VTGGGSTHLDSIVAGVREDLEARKRALPFAEVEARSLAVRRDRRVIERLSGGASIIAEIKRASPSKGWIDPGLDAAGAARAYAGGGAAAISVLTEGRRFGGSLKDLEDASAASGEVPVLRKDFLLDEYMVAEARAFGADLVLLMVSVLGDATRGLLEASTRHGLEALVEVRDEAELAVALDAGARIVGINNRDLTTLSVDLSVAERMLPKIPPGVVKVVESGISDPGEVARYRALGADAFLVGEALVRSGDPAAEIRRLLSLAR